MKNKVAPYLRKMMSMIVLTAIVGGGVSSANARTSPQSREKWEVNAPTPSQKAAYPHEIEELVERMRDRHVAELKNGLDQHYIAVTTSGWLNLRTDQIEHLSPQERSILEKTIQDENKERKLLQQKMANHYGTPQLEESLRQQFAENWLQAAERANWLVFNPKFGTFRTLS